MSIPESHHPLVRLSPDEAALLERVKTLVAERIGPDADRVAQQDVFAWGTFRLLCREGIVATAFPRAGAVIASTDAPAAHGTGGPA